MAESQQRAVIPGSGFISRLGAAAIEETDSEDLKLRKSLLMFASGLMNMAAILWLLIYWWMGLKLPTSVPLGFQFASAIVLVIYLRTRNFDFFRMAQLALFLFFPFVIQWSIGSFVSSSGIALLALLAPVGAMVCYGARESIPWFVAYVVLTVLSGVFDFFLARGQDSGIPMRTVAVFFVMNFTIISTMVYLLLRFFVMERDRFEKKLEEQHELVRAEREKSEALLLNILPGHIAERLKHQPGTIADGFPDVSVMFADVVNFTRLAEELTPNQVVSFLDEVFARFDELTERHGLDKIKTIGDAYMVVGGLTENREGYADHVADMALEMIELTNTDPHLVRLGVQLHVGIATGPAVAGVIGAKRFIYDVWGDTVNLASRLTAEAEAGSILVDKTTFRRLGHRYSSDEPKDILIKGKGNTTTYRLSGKLYSG
ncbi:MAG TPA: adenylate/guanylate cyclase domain-containing protein [Burkholderiales bacterium]|nr:adenylate/guanylate cyclase domain-containing protein [Burkholderiales bacterium]